MLASTATMATQSAMDNRRDAVLSMAILLLGLRDVWRSPPDVAICAVPQLVPLGCAILLAITARA
jgi:hypothetical protein